MNAKSIFEAYKIVMDCIERNKEENKVDWDMALSELSESFNEPINTMLHYGEPNYVKDMFAMIGEMVAIIRDGNASGVKSESVIKSVIERIRFLSFGDINVWVNVYNTERCYGGAEEGGWWYDWTELVDSKFCTIEEADNIVAEMHKEHGEGEGDISSVLGGYEVDIRIEAIKGESKSTERPYYC